jgi:hypothetical protein
LTRRVISDSHPVGRPNVMVDEGEFGSLSSNNAEGTSETDAVDHSAWLVIYYLFTLPLIL